jgi:hypothetical protein
VTRPDRQPTRRPRWRSRPALVAVSALLLVAAVVALVAIVGRDDSDNEVTVGADGKDGGGPAGQGNDAVVAVTYGDASVGGEAVELELRFLDADGSVIAERSWSEVEQSAAGTPGEAVVMGGLLQRVPGGDLSLEATLQQDGEPMSCIQSFTAAAGDRTILRLQLGSAAETECAQVESVADWAANRTGQTGVDYVGLTEAEADARAQAAGLTTRVVGVDGVDLAVTMDLRPDRLNLMLFDGVVVAAQLDGEEAAPSGLECPANASCDSRIVAIPALPAGQGTLAIDLEPVDGAPSTEHAATTLQVYDSRGELVAEPDWGRSNSGMLHTAVPAGQLRLVSSVRTPSTPDGFGCQTAVDLDEGGYARVTLFYAEDERGACASLAAATFEGERLLDMLEGLPASGFVGLTEDEAIDEAAVRGWTVRVLARDGEREPRTDDYRPERVNLVLEDGRATAAARS